MTPKRTHNEQGFTLVEMLVVILVIGILMTIGSVTYTKAILNGKKKHVETGMHEVVLGLDKFSQNHTRDFPGMIALTDENGYSGDYVMNALIGGSLQDNMLLEGVAQGDNILINQDVPTMSQENDQRKPIQDALLRERALEGGYARNLLRGGELRMRNLGLMKMYVLGEDYGRSPTFESGEIFFAPYNDFGTMEPGPGEPLMLVDNALFEEAGPTGGAMQFADYLEGSFVYIPLKTTMDMQSPTFFKYVKDYVILCYDHPVEAIDGSRATGAVDNQYVDMAYMHDGIDDPDGTTFLFPDLEAPLGDSDPSTLNPYELWVNNWFKLAPRAVSWSDNRYWPKEIDQL